MSDIDLCLTVETGGFSKVYFEGGNGVFAGADDVVCKERITSASATVWLIDLFLIFSSGAQLYGTWDTPYQAAQAILDGRICELLGLVISRDLMTKRKIYQYHTNFVNKCSQVISS